MRVAFKTYRSSKYCFQSISLENYFTITNIRALFFEGKLTEDNFYGNIIHAKS
jgi:hypothetical protein